LVHLLSRRLGPVATRELKVSIGRSLSASLLALAVSGAITFALPEVTKLDALLSLTAASVAGAGIYLAVMAVAGAPELRRFTALAKRKNQR